MTTSRSRKLKKDDAAQSKAFIEKAKEIGADKKSDKTDAVLGQLAKLKPDPRKKSD